MNKRLNLTSTVFCGHDGEDDVAHDGGKDDGGDYLSADGDAMRLFEQPSREGTADDSSDGEQCLVDGHSERPFLTAGNAVEHAVRIGMCAENA